MVIGNQRKKYPKKTFFFKDLKITQENWLKNSINLPTFKHILNYGMFGFLDEGQIKKEYIHQIRTKCHDITQ